MKSIFEVQAILASLNLIFGKLLKFIKIEIQSRSHSDTVTQCGKMKNLRQIKSLVLSLVKRYFHEIFVKEVKCEGEFP